MSFLSQANSTETLGRGLELLDSMSAGAATAGDPSPEEMMAELQRLQAPSHSIHGGLFLESTLSHPRVPWPNANILYRKTY